MGVPIAPITHLETVKEVEMTNPAREALIEILADALLAQLRRPTPLPPQNPGGA